MNYNNLVEKARNGTLTEEDAKEYLGKELVEQIEWLKNYCAKNSFEVYAHGTIPEAAKNIVKRGYDLGYKTISFNEYKSATKIINPREYFKDAQGYKCDIGDIGEHEEYEMVYPFEEKVDGSFSGHLSQHFTKGFPASYKSLVSRFIAHNMGYPCSAMCFFAFPINSSLKQRIKKVYLYRTYAIEGDDGYSIREVLNKYFCLGYLDIANKKIYFNKKFGIHSSLANYEDFYSAYSSYFNKQTTNKHR